MPPLTMQTVSPLPVDGAYATNDQQDFYCPCSAVGESSSSSIPSEDTISRVASHFDVMRHQESTNYRAYDYLARSPAGNGQRRRIDESCREKMIEWCYQVVDYCTFQRSTVATAMSILDRFLCAPAHPVAQECMYDRKSYQLAAMTALYTAVKISEPAVFDPAIISSLGRGAVTEDQVVEMERHLLEAIGWRVCPPTSSSLVYALVDLLPSTSTVPAVHARIRSNLLSLALYQTELAVADYELVPVRASTIALSAILNAAHAMEGVLSEDIIEMFLKYIQRATGVDIASVGVDQVMNRLMMLVDSNVDERQVEKVEVPLRLLSRGSSNIEARTNIVVEDAVCQQQQQQQQQQHQQQQQQQQQRHQAHYHQDLKQAPSSSSNRSRTERRRSNARSLSPTCVMRGAAKQQAATTSQSTVARYLAQ